MRKYIILTLLLGLSASLFAQHMLPVSTENILVFVEPFENQGPDFSQEWLQNGFPGFIQSSLETTDHIVAYGIPDFKTELIDRPHRLQNLIWKAVFNKQVNPQYETYLLLGSYSYLDGNISIRMDLLSLHNTRVLARFEKSMSYTKLLTWKDGLGNWVVDQLRMADETPETEQKVKTFKQDDFSQLPGIANKEEIPTLFEKSPAPESADLKRSYERQQKEQLGTQIEKLWKDIAYDPYLAEIHDIKTQRLNEEPDSVLVRFEVSYRVNPRILDEIEHFTRSRSGRVARSAHYDEHAFMDLGYIDAEFTERIASGDWRVVPIVTIGSKTYKKQRVIYHSFPRPIRNPGEYFFNRGEFKQLLMAVPGVDALRIFAHEQRETYTYELLVGHNELSQLSKIQVKFVPEHRLSSSL